MKRTILSIAIIVLTVSFILTRGEELKMVEVEGKLTKVKMTNFDWNPWEEYALQTADGRLIILIGKKAEELKNLLGKELVVRGEMKHPLKVKGKETATLEVKNIRTKGK